MALENFESIEQLAWASEVLKLDAPEVMKLLAQRTLKSLSKRDIALYLEKEAGRGARTRTAAWLRQ